MKKRINRILAAALCLLLVFSAVPPVTASAEKASDNGISVTKLKSTNEDGKFHMRFTIQSKDAVTIWGKVVNSAGKQVFSWNSAHLSEGKKTTKSYGADYSNLPTGKYTFMLYVEQIWLGDTFHFDYTINVNNTYAKYLSTGKLVNSDGSVYNKFNFTCKNIKGKKLYLEIYNSSGKRVFKRTGLTRKTNNEVGWFAWNGYPESGGLQCKSGTYTLKYWYDGATPLQQTVKLKI